MMDEELPRISYPSLIAFLAGFFCLRGKYTPKKELCVSDHVPSRGFCFLGKHVLKKSYASRISVPSRGFFPVTLVLKNDPSRISVPSRLQGLVAPEKTKP